MRKITLTLGIVFFSLAAIAQEGFNIGLHLSPIISYATVLDAQKNDISTIETKAKLGLSYGLIFNYGFTDNYAFHSGVHIVNKGYNYTQDGSESLNYNVTSVEIPLGLKLRSNEVASGVHIKGLFGISLDVNVAHESEYLDGTTVISTKATDRINPVGATFIFGPGADVVTDVGTFTLGIIYHQGLSNLNNKNKAGNENIIRISYVSLDLGYIF